MHTLLDEAGLRLGLAEAAVVTVVATGAVLALPVTLALVPTAALVLAVARLLTLPGALCLAVSAWAFLTGFVENTLGQLTLAPADLGRLALLVAVGSIPVLVGKGTHWRRAR